MGLCTVSGRRVWEKITVGEPIIELWVRKSWMHRIVWEANGSSSLRKRHMLPWGRQNLAKGKVEVKLDKSDWFPSALILYVSGFHIFLQGAHGGIKAQLLSEGETREAAEESRGREEKWANEWKGIIRWGLETGGVDDMRGKWIREDRYKRFSRADYCYGATNVDWSPWCFQANAVLVTSIINHPGSMSLQPCTDPFLEQFFSQQ